MGRYTDDEVARMGLRGQAFRAPDGRFERPIGDVADLLREIAAPQPRDRRASVRRYLERRARTLGRSHLIPREWRGPHATPGKPGPTTPVADEGSCWCECGACQACDNRDTKSDNALDGSEGGGEGGGTSGGDLAGHRSALTVGVRAGGEAGEMVLVGAPIVYGVPYTVHDSLGSFLETMAPGVCRGLLQRGVDCRFLLNHDGMPLARTPVTLSLWDTPGELRCKAVLNDSQLSRDLFAAVQRGDVNQMSIGFLTGEDSWNEDYTTRVVRSIADLLDVSAVTYPASPTTWIRVAGSQAVRAMEREHQINQLRRRAA